MTEFDEPAIEPIVSWNGFVAKKQPHVTLFQLGHKPTDTFGISPDLTDIPNLALATLFGNRHGVAGLGSIQCNENLCMLLHGSSSRAEDRPAHTGNPRRPAQCGTSHPTDRRDMR